MERVTFTCSHCGYVLPIYPDDTDFYDEDELILCPNCKRIFVVLK